MPIKKKRSRKLADWSANWSWPRLIEILTNSEAPERIEISRILWRVQADAFQELREAIEDPADSASWDNPFIERRIDFPFEWETERSLPEITTQPNLKMKQLFIALQALAGGVAWRAEDGSLRPLAMPPVRETLKGFSEEEIQRCLREWLNPKELMRTLSFGDNNLEDEYDRTISGQGHGIRFMASLSFYMTPLIIDYSSRRSFFVISVGLPWVISEGASLPPAWTEAEREALWGVIAIFFKELSRASDLSDFKKKVIVKVNKRLGVKGLQFEHFGAFFTNHADISYLQKTSPPTLEYSSMKSIPKYATGAQGPALDILDKKGALHSIAGLKLLCVMAHPESELYRRELFCHAMLRVAAEYVPMQLKAAAHDGELIEKNWDLILRELGKQWEFPPLSMLKVLASAPSADDVFARAYNTSFYGAIVGDMLLFILGCAQHCPRHMSINKAAFVQSKILIGAKDQAGNLLHYGLATVRTAWGKFRPVAHLWAAYRIWQIDHKEAPDLSPFEPDGLPNFLAAAEELRRLGTSTFARAQKLRHGPILNPAETWRTPSGLCLPSVTLTCSPPSQRALTYLREYRAAKAS